MCGAVRRTILNSALPMTISQFTHLCNPANKSKAKKGVVEVAWALAGLGFSPYQQMPRLSSSAGKPQAAALSRAPA